MILVSSTITYIPDNYIDVLEKIIKKNKKDISAIVLIKVNKIKLLKKIFLLFLACAPRLAFVLSKNLIKDIFDTKEKHFKKKGVKVIKIKNINDEEILNFIKKNEINFILNLRSRSIYKKEIIGLVKNILNVHHGILPKNRGVFSDMRNLVYDGELGFSIHKINDKIDDGNILKIKKIEYKRDKKYLEYLKYSSNIEGDILADFVFNFLKNKEINKKENNAKNIILYKNPTWKELKEMKKNGLVL